MSRIIGALALVALAASQGNTVELGDKDAGRAYAQNVCADCHAIEKNAEALVVNVPSFQEIADTQGMSHRALRVWLQTSHPTMPNFMIPPSDMDNLAAYIMSLRTPKGVLAR